MRSAYIKAAFLHFSPQKLGIGAWSRTYNSQYYLSHFQKINLVLFYLKTYLKKAKMELICSCQDPSTTYTEYGGGFTKTEISNISGLICIRVSS